MEPKNCQVCDASLETYHVYDYNSKAELVGAYCYDCDKDRNMKNYLESKVLTTALVNNVQLDLYDLGSKDSCEYNSLRNVLYGSCDEAYKKILNLRNKIDIYLSYIKIVTTIRLFEEIVWFNGLQKIIKKSKNQKISAKYEYLNCLTFSMCARTMITIENKQASITMMCDEDSQEKTMHFRGICATEEQAIDLIDTCIQLFVNGKLDFKEDNNISYCGV